jgi:hypothetical protein
MRFDRTHLPLGSSSFDRSHHTYILEVLWPHEYDIAKYKILAGESEIA